MVKFDLKVYERAAVEARKQLEESYPGRRFTISKDDLRRVHESLRGQIKSGRLNADPEELVDEIYREIEQKIQHDEMEGAPDAESTESGAGEQSAEYEAWDYMDPNRGHNWLVPSVRWSSPNMALPRVTVPRVWLRIPLLAG